MCPAPAAIAMALFGSRLCELPFSRDIEPRLFWVSGWESPLSSRESLRSSGVESSEAESSEVVLSELPPQLAAKRARGISRQRARI